MEWKESATLESIFDHFGNSLRSDLDLAYLDFLEMFYYGITERTSDEVAPNETALANTKRVLTEIYAISPRRYMVYPMFDGSIAIDIRGKRTPDGIGIFLYGDGKASMSGNIGNQDLMSVTWRKLPIQRYDDASLLPDDTLRDWLRQMDEADSK